MDIKNKAAQGKYFLALTALEEFWDTSIPIVFLGEWCLRYGRRRKWEQLDAGMVKSPWANLHCLENACRYTNEVYEKWLKLLAGILNRLHKVDYSERYWRILLGPWLVRYIEMLYDRYLTLCAALEQYPDLTTIGLSEKTYVTPSDTLGFALYYIDDFYNLQIYSKILAELGVNISRKEFREPIEDTVFHNNGFKKFVLGQTSRIFSFLINRFLRSGNRIYLRDSHFSNSVQFQLLIRSMGKVFTMRGPMLSLPDMDLNRQARQELQRDLPDSDGFQGVLKSTLPFDIPLNLIEAYDMVNQKMKQTYPKGPRAIFSCTGWQFDEVFKRWAANETENGTLLLGSQHGGNNGSLAHLASFEHEISITDRYYSWGWEGSIDNGKIRPFFSSRFTGIKPIGPDNRKKGILFGATAPNRYLTVFPFLTDYFSEYVAWQSRFAKAVAPSLLKRMRIRFRDAVIVSMRYSWELPQRWEDAWPEVGVDDYEIPFRDSLDNCRLYVCDHLGTTFIEALSADKPSILFWSNSFNRLTIEAQPYYDGLREVGILHDTPEGAAKTLNAVYSDVESWWNNSERQETRRVFCERFARSSPTAVDEWLAEFKRIAKGNMADNAIHQSEK